MTGTVEQEKNIVCTSLLVGIRTFDHRRFGMLFQKYRKSGAWSIPALKVEKGQRAPFELMQRVADTIPIAGPRRIIAATTLFATTSDRLMVSDTNDYHRWEMIVYDVQFEGAVIISLNAPNIFMVEKKRLYVEGKHPPQPRL